jgi:hypothetical protein
MKDISRLQNILSPEQLKALEDVFEKRELTLESFKLMRKDYARVKANVKRIEKKLLALIEEEGHDAFIGKWIEREVASIENKYAAIENAIKHYNTHMQSFNRTITSPHFYSFSPGTGYGSTPNQLRSCLSSASGRIDEALNAIRITKRYFKNITSAFKSHREMMERKKQRERTKWLNDLKAMKEAEAITVVPESTEPGVVMPESTEQVSEASAVLPESIEQESDTTVGMPESTEQKPETSVVAPEPPEQKPETIVVVPESPVSEEPAFEIFPNPNADVPPTDE